MSDGNDARGLTRRQLLAASSVGAVTAGTTLASGCAVGQLAQVPPAVRMAALAPERAVESGALWEQFCETLKPLARHVAGGAAPDDPLARVEGLRCLSRLVSLGLDRFLEYGDPLFPAFYDLQTETRKYLGDNPDQSYRVASIDGGEVYRVRGNARGAAGIELGVYAGTFRSDDEGPSRRLVASLDEAELVLDEKGDFEVTLGGEPGAGNHLALSEDANALLIRTYFWDRELRRSHRLPRIERLGRGDAAPTLTPEALVRGFIAAVAFVDGSLAWWNAFEGFDSPDNTLIVMPDDGSVQTPRQVRYMNGWVAPARDEAFVVELRPQDEPSYWSFALQNVWGETPDWRFRPVIRNNRELERSADGSVRIVVAHADPGVANWMDMSGHERLLLSLRWRGASALPRADTRLVPLAQLA